MAAAAHKERPRAARTRARILDLAEEHFARSGYEATRLEDIAESLGIRRAALFYYFRDKRELYQAVLDHAFGGLLDRLLAALSGPRPLPERIEAGVGAWVDFAAERPTVARILLREGAQVSPERREDLVRFTRPFSRCFARSSPRGSGRGTSTSGPSTRSTSPPRSRAPRSSS